MGGSGTGDYWGIIGGLLVGLGGIGGLGGIIGGLWEIGGGIAGWVGRQRGRGDGGEAAVKLQRYTHRLLYKANLLPAKELEAQKGPPG